MLLKIDFKTVNTVLAHAFNLKICFKYAVVGIVYLVVCGLFLTVKFSCLFTAVAVAVLASLLKVPNASQETFRGRFEHWPFVREKLTLHQRETEKDEGPISL